MAGRLHEAAAAALQMASDADAAPVVEASQWLQARVDAEPQARLAAAAFVVGVLFLAVGSFLIKPLFITFCGLLCGVGVQSVLVVVGCPEAGAQMVAVVVAVATLRLWHHTYPGFSFLIGCALGGCSVFVAFALVVARKDPGSILAATILSAVVIGLSFVRFHDAWWRALTPPAGALVAAASLRCLAVLLCDQDAKWSSFGQDLERGLGSALHASGALLWTAWAVFAMLGWYLQMGPLVGLRRRRPLLPPWVPRQCPMLLECLGILDADAARGDRLLPLPGRLSRPLLETSQDTDEQVGLDVPHLASLTKAAGEAFLKEDHRPEVALLTAIISVVSLNAFLAHRPLLFLGHAVLMSIAFLPLMTAGMVSYASPSLLLPSLFVPSSPSIRRRWSHTVFNGLSLVCVLGGYACIYAFHRETRRSQLGLDHLRDPSRFLHVLIGYGVIALMLLQAFTGIAALHSKLKPHCHALIGRLVYCGGGLDLLIAYTFPGFLPVWAAPVMSALLMLTIGSTLFFLQEKNRIEEVTARLEEKRAHLRQRIACVERNWTVQSGHSLSSQTTAAGSGQIVHQQPEGRPRVSTSDAGLLDAADKALARNYRMTLLALVFAEWHRGMQRQRLEDAAEAMEGQDRLVQFLSQGMVEQGLR